MTLSKEREPEGGLTAESPLNPPWGISATSVV